MARPVAPAILSLTHRIACQGWRNIEAVGLPLSRPSIGLLQQTEVTMLVTLVAILCNGQLYWLANGQYHKWKLQAYRLVLGKYTPKREV
jgi:hypothetical protein